MRSRTFTLALTFALLALAAPSQAGDVDKHSGTIVDFDPATDTIVLAEVGPWQVRDGATVITRRTVKLTPQTEFEIAFRTEDGEGLFAGQYIEAPIERAGVYIDDYVTIECRHENARLIAMKITVVDLPGGAYTKENGR